MGDLEMLTNLVRGVPPEQTALMTAMLEAMLRGVDQLSHAGPGPGSTPERQKGWRESLVHLQHALKQMPQHEILLRAQQNVPWIRRGFVSLHGRNELGLCTITMDRETGMFVAHPVCPRHGLEFSSVEATYPVYCTKGSIYSIQLLTEEQYNDFLARRREAIEARRIEEAAEKERLVALNAKVAALGPSITVCCGPAEVAIFYPEALDHQEMTRWLLENTDADNHYIHRPGLLLIRFLLPSSKTKTQLREWAQKVGAKFSEVTREKWHERLGPASAPPADEQTEEQHDDDLPL